MEIVSGLLGGLGLLGILAAALLGLVALLILPFWAILECALSRRTGGGKALLIVLLFFTCGLGSLVYGLFVTTSKVLRIVTVLAVVGILAILVPSVISLLAGAGMHGKLHAEQLHRENQELVAQFQPAAIPSGDLDAFHALHFTWGGFGPATAAVARFTGAGPDLDSVRDTDRGVRQVTFDLEHERTWALTAHEFGSIEPASGRFTKITVDPAVGDFSWPKGIAFDPRDESVLVMTSHVYTLFYRFAPRTSEWERLPAEIRDLPLVALTYAPLDGCLYALEFRSSERALRRLQRFNTKGASLGPIELHPAVPVPDRADEGLQLVTSGEKLVLILPPLPDGRPGAASRTYVVDPRTGEVFAPGAASAAL